MNSSTLRSQQVNRAIYLGDEGVRLMRPSCFTAEVRQFHHRERLFYLDLLGTTRYELIIEVGCSGYRLIGIKDDDNDYLGIEINPPRVRRLKSRRAAVMRCEAGKFFKRTRLIDEIMRRYDEKVLCILPFNFLGTMDAPMEFLTLVCKAPFDLALSLFSTSETATLARHEYYDLCGITVQGVVRTDDYVRLECSNGFQAFAFDPVFLVNCISAYGFRLNDIEYYDVCNLLHFKKRKS
ncbi:MULTISPECIES: hypothetical protein [Bradyrhizobium]|uniref:Class I SAM-dependent methyltransferase n=1 Tax=Bradyrhizobium brasilense TaxID=1419277 RepID=A0ABY8JCR5_9BRAD|nr:hypothetical protein [Bradyrhizobium brasilense]WFU62411.1 hypothetical protein QA636_33695 [Bradyrhizobium brasilense]